MHKSLKIYLVDSKTAAVVKFDNTVDECAYWQLEYTKHILAVTSYHPSSTLHVNGIIFHALWQDTL